jgi:hypothetical protein
MVRPFAVVIDCGRGEREDGRGVVGYNKTVPSR